MSGYSVYSSAAGRYAAESTIKKIFEKYTEMTVSQNVIRTQAGFGGMYAPDGDKEDGPVIVSGTDGVGSKLKLAVLMNKNDTVGIDCVALAANSVVCTGARPIFFSNYLAMGKKKPELIEEIVSGIAKGCVQAGCTLIGGETSETPGTYSSDEYDLAGFCVGVAQRSSIIDCTEVSEGDALIAVRSSGLHSDGYSAVMRILRVTENNIRIYLNDLGKTLGEELITPSRIYVPSILRLVEEFRPHGIANITGGGIMRNVPRMIPDGLCARISRAKLRAHPIFSIIRSMNNVDDSDMFRTFNMGVGMMIAAAPDKADAAVALLNACGEEAYIIGEVIKEEPKIILQ